MRPLLASTGNTEILGPIVHAPEPPVANVPQPVTPSQPGAHAPEPAQPPEEPVAVEASQPDAQPAAPEPKSPAEPAETYSGRLYLMFPSTLSQSRLETVWDILDQLGNIADTRLISRDAGIQFTLELGNKLMAVEDLRKLIPNCRIEALEENRLRVIWPD